MRHAPGQVEESVWIQLGRYGWATVGIAAALVIFGLIAGRLSIVVVPLVLALFPAALLSPTAEALKRRRVPAAAASLLLILGTLLAVAGVIGLITRLVAAELPALTQSFDQGLEQFEGLLQRLPLGVTGLDELVQQAQDALAGRGGQLASGLIRAGATLVEVVTAILFGVVVLFFYLKDGPRIARGIQGLLPERARPHLAELSARAWDSVGRYFRGQLLIALMDAVGIGIGLALLGVPLALPLAVLIFIGGLFPIVGAFVSGTVAVLVALAHAGVSAALAVLILIVAVQQIESNVFAPLILGSAVALHPLVVLTALTAGAVLLGVLGAFLAVPVAAAIGRAVDYARRLASDSEEVSGYGAEQAPERA